MQVGDGRVIGALEGAAALAAAATCSKIFNQDEKFIGCAQWAQILVLTLSNVKSTTEVGKRMLPEKKRFHVHGFSTKNDICIVLKLSPQGIYLHYWTFTFKKKVRKKLQ